jgi:hypothetical protein
MFIKLWVKERIFNTKGETMLKALFVSKFLYKNYFLHINLYINNYVKNNHKFLSKIKRILKPIYFSRLFLTTTFFYYFFKFFKIFD